MAALLQTHGRGWIQESYETGDPDLKTRAKQLRALGYRVVSSSMGPQVTQYGVVKMTLLDIRPGTSGDEYLEQVNPRRRGRRNVGWKRTGLGKRSIRAFKKRSKKEGFKHEDIQRTIKSHFYKGAGKVKSNAGIRERRARGTKTGRFPGSWRVTKKRIKKRRMATPSYAEAISGLRGLSRKRMKEIKYGRSVLNAPRVKGRKVKGGRAVTLRNFTGTIVRKSDGTVNILGRGRKR